MDQLVAEFGESLFAGGTFVFRQGDDAARIHVVRTGTVELSKMINGRRVALQILRPGDVFGDVPAFLGEPEPFDARAIEDCAILSLDAPSLFEMLQTRPQVARRWIVSLAERMRGLQQRLGDLLAAVHAAVIAADTALADQRVCIVGARSAGTGIAAMLADAIAADGATDPGSHLYLIDADGLLHDHRHDLTAHQQPFAQPWDHVADWANPTGPTPLAAVVDHVVPTVLIGVSGQPGLFTEPIIRSMAATTPHPIVLPLSNPTDRAEALPGDLLAWTDGRALIATGSPFGPVTRNGATHTIAQANNVYIFPGLGLGALAAGAHRITDSMLRAAARAVADTSACTTAGPSAPILPVLDDLHTVSRRIANAVANAAINDHVSQNTNRDDIDSRIAQHWWTPDYQTAAPTVQTRLSPSQ